MSKGLKRGLAALVVIPLLYALLGFFLLPWAGLKLVNQKLAEYATLPASLERIEFNPFTLELTLHQLRLGAPGAEQLGFARLYADLQIDSLWQRALHLREVQLEQPHVELLFAADRPFNLLRLFRLPPPATEAKPQPAGELFPLYVDHLQLTGGSVHLVDERPQPGIEVRYEALDLELRNFGTRAEDNGELQLKASGSSGASIAAQAHLRLQPLRAEGHLSITDIMLKAWWPYVRRLVPLELEQGMASLASDYRLEWQEGLHLQLDNSQLQLSTLQLHEADGKPLLDLDKLEASSASLALSPGPQLRVSNGQLRLAALELHRPAEQPLLKLASLEVADTALDLAGRQLTVGQLRSQGLEAWAARETDGRLDWQALLERQLAALAPQPAADPQPTVTPPNDVPPAANTPASPPAGSPAAPQSTAPDAASTTGRLPAELAQPSPTPTGPWQVLLKDVQLRSWRAHLEDRASKPATPLEVGPLDLDLQNLASDLSQPFRLKLASGLGARGHLEAAGQARLQPLSSQLKVVARDLDLRVAQAYLSPFLHLELRSGLLAGDVAVDLTGIAPLALKVSGRAQVSQLHTLDTLKGRDFVKWHTLDLDGFDYRHGEQLRIDRLRLQQPYARFVINEDLSTNVKELLIPQPPSPAPAPSARPLHIVIGGVEIQDGSANFTDFSLTPDFATAIQQLNGHIGTLDSQSKQPATVDVRGKVDRYAPVSIQGRLTPFSPLEQLDITTRFRRVELTTLTPYAGKFAGYKIRKGRLNLDLHYRIEKGQLNAENKVLLEHLQLGERVDSPSATDLPVRLAVALLKDTDGNIDIALPVKGDLNNPEFSVLPIVWQTLRNLVLRAVQAPFKLIAGLLDGGEEQLDSVPFAAGSSELDEQARGTLDKLARALQQRPALRLEVEGMSAQAIDGPLLAERRLAREYQDIWYRMLQRRGDKVPADASQLKVPQDMQATLLEGIYRARLKQQPPAEWRDLKKPERAARLRQAVLDSWAQSSLLLRQLAQDRARAIKAYLVEHGRLADERIYLLEVGSAEATNANQRIAVPLHLDSE
jgi:outer membrane protein OmpA-like peptidoglycan-associated protein